MRRSVKRWMVRLVNGSLADGEPPHTTREGAERVLWMAGESAVLVTITYDDGRPAARRRKSKRVGFKKAYVKTVLPKGGRRG